MIPPKQRKGLFFNPPSFLRAIIIRITIISGLLLVVTIIPTRSFSIVTTRKTTTTRTSNVLLFPKQQVKQTTQLKEATTTADEEVDGRYPTTSESRTFDNNKNTINVDVSHNNNALAHNNDMVDWESIDGQTLEDIEYMKMAIDLALEK